MYCVILFRKSLAWLKYFKQQKLKHRLGEMCFPIYTLGKSNMNRFEFRDFGVQGFSPCIIKLCSYVLVFILEAFLLDSWKRLQAHKCIDFRKNIERHSPLEFLKCHKLSTSIWPCLVKSVPMRLRTLTESWESIMG